MSIFIVKINTDKNIIIAKQQKCDQITETRKNLWYNIVTTKQNTYLEDFYNEEQR